MRQSAFDDLTRRFANWPAISRRTLLQALGLTGAAGALSRSHARAQDATPTSAAGQSLLPTIQQLAFDLEYDPQAIYEFVATRVQYEPYAGVLRGPDGALRAMAGNAADQAMLLSALLTEAQVPNRLVAGTLRDDSAQRLVRELIPDAAAIATRADAVLAPAAGTEAGPKPTADQQAALDFVGSLVPAVLDTTKTQFDAAVAQIDTALRNAGVSIAAPVAALPDREQSQHLWVQMASGPNWTDLDPSVPAATAGERYADQATPLAALPDELLHTVTIRVIGEFVRGGQAVMEEMLTHTFPSHEAGGIPLTVFNAPPESLQGIGVGVSDIVAGTRQYVPYLVTDRQTVAGTKNVTLGGAGGVLGAFGEKGDTEGQTLSQWLELEINSPDAAAAKISRPIFDRADPAARAASAIDPTTIPPVQLTQVGEEGEHYLPALDLWALSVAMGWTPWSHFTQPLDSTQTFSALAQFSHGHHFTRDAMDADYGRSAGVARVLTRPNVTATIVSLAGPAGLETGAGLRMDALHRAWTAGPIGSATPAVHPGIVAGVLAHVAERAVLGDGWTDASATVSHASVGRVFEQAAANGVDLLVLTAERREGLDKLPSARAAIEAATGGGAIVVVPAEPVELNGKQEIGWWEIDPQTGFTIDRLDSGEGGVRLDELPENATLLQKIGYAFKNFRKLGCAVAIMYYVAAIFISGAGGSYAAGGDKAAKVLGSAAAATGAVASAAKQLPGGNACK